MTDAYGFEVLARLRTIVDGLGTQKVAAEKAGIPYATLQRMLKGKSPITTERLQKIADAAGVSIEQIVGNERAKALRDLLGYTDIRSVVAETLSANGVAEAVRDYRGMASDDAAMPAELSSASVALARVPVFDQRVSAGSGFEVVDPSHAISELRFPASFLRQLGGAQDLMALNVAGDSMRPTVDDGSLLIFRKGDVREADGVFVILQHDQLRAKRLTFLGEGKIRVSSDNPDYKDGDHIVDLNRDAVDQRRDFIIIGRAVWTGAKL